MISEHQFHIILSCWLGPVIVRNFWKQSYSSCNLQLYRSLKVFGNIICDKGLVGGLISDSNSDSAFILRSTHFRHHNRIRGGPRVVNWPTDFKNIACSDCLPYNNWQGYWNWCFSQLISLQKYFFVLKTPNILQKRTFLLNELLVQRFAFRFDRNLELDKVLGDHLRAFVQ